MAHPISKAMTVAGLCAAAVTSAQAQNTTSAAQGAAPTRAQQIMGDINPKLADLTDKVLFGDIWERPGLSKRDRSLATVAALIALNRPEQLRSHMALALTNGVTQQELVELITHLAFYTGWPNAISAIPIARETFSKSSEAATKQATANLEVFRADASTPSRGSADNFTGEALVTGRFRTSAPALASGGTVTFKAGARTAWHSHPRGQMLIVLSGHGIVQTWGNPAQLIGPGDTVWIPPGAKHWHGAAPDDVMTHVAIADMQGDNVVTWMEQVSAAQYAEASRKHAK